ncbi:hypothetical protein NPX13_g3618 [Xylaria arbuscula]|uniref:Uncharacterized protein n=1 Tax=Xylaria arbuscula TaxID=114810 RepID=A0A9W8NHJ1_9PEZI|nr:hypothetical protein NPX13_g3618 [Xylaria arbuscula]
MLPYQKPGYCNTNIKMSVSTEVQSLYGICDNIDSDPPPTRTLSTRSLLRLVETEALAFLTPGSPRLLRLVECFQKCQEVAHRYPIAESEWLIDLIRQWFILVDECFFFDTLTREVNTYKRFADGGASINTREGRRHLVAFQVVREYSGLSDPVTGQPKMGYHVLGDYSPLTRELQIFLKLQIPVPNVPIYEIRRTPIVSILHTIVHESVHAYLQTFANPSHPTFKEDVAKNNGHGQVFGQIHQVIAEKILSKKE